MKQYHLINIKLFGRLCFSIYWEQPTRDKPNQQLNKGNNQSQHPNNKNNNHKPKPQQQQQPQTDIPLLES